MAESQEQASSPSNLKEKTSLLDVDFGKDFLSSWKSMSMPNGDAMDFDFGTIGKGKKAFNFDKLDVDFLDGDLEKLSSFKVDISDLDISSPPKKVGKSKDVSKESVVGNHQQKQDRFSFAFDFNELDNFSFEPNLIKEGKQSIKNHNSEDTSNRNECHGSGTDLTDAIDAPEVGPSWKLPASVGAITSKIEIPLGSSGHVNSIKENSPSNSARHDNCPSKYSTLQTETASVKTRTLPEKITTAITHTENQESHDQEKAPSPEPYAQEGMQDLLVQSVSENESTRYTASELQVGGCSLTTKVSSNAGGDQSGTCKSVAGLLLDCENPVLENLSAQHMERSLPNNGDRDKLMNDNNVSVRSADNAVPAEGDSSSEGTSSISVPMEAIHVMKDSGDDQNANRKLHLAPSSSGITVGKLSQMKYKEGGISQTKLFRRKDGTESQSQQAPSTQTKHVTFGGKRTGYAANEGSGTAVGKQIQMKGRENGSSSKLFKRPDENESESQKAPSTQEKPTTFGGKRIGFGQQGAADGGREDADARDAESGSKLAGNSTPDSRKLNKGEPVQPGSGSNIKGLKGVEELLNASGMIKGSKLFGSSRLHGREVTKGEPLQRNEKSIKNVIALRIPTSSIVSVRNSNDVSGEVNKVSPPKTGRSLLDLSTLKISRAVGADPLPSKVAVQKEIKSLRSAAKIVKLQGSTVSNMAHSVCTEKQTPPTPSLKRKKFEGLNADMLSLNPSKRLSPSHTERRSGECSEMVVGKEICSQENLANDNAFTGISALDNSLEVNMTELHIPLLMKNDVNVEKAEAYTKELENICNMLKKKHEEAKEILVRAVVNNNNLLMLNHPIYEEKFRKVQKFAAQLMSKQLHA